MPHSAPKSDSSIEWDAPPYAHRRDSKVEGPPKQTRRVTFEGIAYRVFPEFGFITPKSLEKVEEFMKANGGRWLKPESREIFFHKTNVLGSAVQNGDLLKFELTVDPRGEFGEKKVMARCVRGGTSGLEQKLRAQAGDVAEVRKKCAQLEQERAADKAVFDGMTEKILGMEKELESLRQLQARIGALEHCIVNIQLGLAEGVENSVKAGLRELVCEQGVYERAKTSVCEDTENLALNSPSESEETAEEEPARKKGTKKSRKYSKARAKYVSSFSSGVFGMLKSSFGLGLLMILVLIFGQIALSSGVIDCEAMVVPMGFRYQVAEVSSSSISIAAKYDDVYTQDVFFIDESGFKGAKSNVELEVHEVGSFDVLKGPEDQGPVEYTREKVLDFDMQRSLIRGVDTSRYEVAKLQKAKAGKATGKDNKKQKRRRRDEEIEGERNEKQPLRQGKERGGENKRRKEEEEK
jgi:hypothetical protein